MEHALALRHREVDREDTLVDGAGQLVSRVSEQPHHLPVLGKDEGLEALNALGSGVVGQQLQELRADAATLMLVGNRKGHLRRPFLVVLAVVAGQPDHSAVEYRDERHTVRVIDSREELDFLRLQGLFDPEEPEVSGFGPEPLEEFDEERPVIGLDRPDPRPATVPKRDIQFVLGRILGHHQTLPRLARGQRSLGG